MIQMFSHIVLLSVFLMSLIHGAPPVAPSTPSAKTLSADSLVLSRTLLQELVLKNDPTLISIFMDTTDIAYLPNANLPASDWLLGAQSQTNVSMAGTMGLNASAQADKEYPQSGHFVQGELGTQTTRTGQSASIQGAYGIDLAKNRNGREYTVLTHRIHLEQQMLRLQTRERIEQLLIEKAQLYLDWVQATLQVQAAQIAVDEANVFLLHIQKKQASYIARKIDVDKAQLQLSQKQVHLEQAKAKQKAQQTALQFSLGVQQPLKLPQKEWRMSESFSPDSLYVQQQYIAQNYLDTAQIHRWLETLPLHTAALLRTQLAKSQADLQVLQESALPTLRVYAGAGLYTPENNWKETPKIFAGVKWQHNLTRTQNQAKQQMARNEVQRTQAQIYNEVVSLLQTLQLLAVEWEGTQQQIAIQKQQIALSESVLQLEHIEYQYGRIGINDLLQAQNRLQEARLAKTNYKITLERIYLRWLHATNELLPNHYILVEPQH
jgi:outer membrane protein TolC